MEKEKGREEKGTAVAGDLILSIRCHVAKHPRVSHDERAEIRLCPRGISRVITGHRLRSPSSKDGEGVDGGEEAARVTR